ncbi:hypothetical protein Taro_021316 [Colocasia esculenta]|uniref:RING-type domain-containing protein n=1 Tax=Colocasia esculenta TaxID=4460 RepID=A0A843UR21_COLES|nr:hypothetical protein [Colocasia esculenta]
MASAAFPPLTSLSVPADAALFSDSDASSSGGEEPYEQVAAVEDSVLSAYLRASGHSSDRQDLAKIRSFLASSCKGSFVACLICLERIRPTDPAWSCSSGCYALFHLLCIQSWARQCSSVPPSSSRPLPASPANWHCPKCRLNYRQDLIPRVYLCYCGKVENPQADPWIVPHSCGEICGRPLRGSCGHECLLLCHPGPCPPCPKLVKAHCFCGTIEDVRRCSFKEFSCNRPCPRLLECRKHRCRENCHQGPCPSCRVKGKFRCLCGKEEVERECCERHFRCERPCDRMLSCGKHTCTRGCHAGPCGDCPLQGKRTCPCGKKEYKRVSCDSIVPTCGSTCEKMLSCNIHRCPERCHQGTCVETCRNVLVKFCRCGSLKKEVPCYQDLICERKCQKLRDCGRHACKRRCCDGNCPPCPEICGRRLRCGNHKCPSPCHRGICAPCPLMISISCACGETHFEVPCGTEKEQKPPKCPKLCNISCLCRHSSTCKPHKCHYGACPPCRIICAEQLPCGHTCKIRFVFKFRHSFTGYQSYAPVPLLCMLICLVLTLRVSFSCRCHGPVPPPNPDFSLRPKKRKQERHTEVPGSPCPPCQEVVWRSCLGQHIGEDRPMVCSTQVRFSCQNLCGNLLKCGNHYCTKCCHALKHKLPSTTSNVGGREPDDDNPGIAEPCEQCSLPCQKERKPACPHPCPRPCHSDDCPPCNVLIKRPCHCGTMVHVFECLYYNTLSDEEQQRIRSCGGPCHRKLPNCPHLCSEKCHPGTCPSVVRCLKKVSVRCACNNLRKEWVCQDAQDALCNMGRDPKDIPRSQFGLGILPCNSDCASKLKIVESELLPRKPKVTEEKITNDDHVPKRRKRRERIKENSQISRFQAIRETMWKFLLLIFIVTLTLAIMYYGYKGLFYLSDWMNEIESRRQQAKHFRRF